METKLNQPLNDTAPEQSMPSEILGPGDLDQSLAYLIRRTHQAFTKALEVRLKPHNISVSMWFFFRVLWKEDGKNQRELSDELGLTQATTVSAMDNMEARGFVKRVRDKVDRRKTNIFLTSEGRSLEAELMPHAAAVNALAISMIPLSDLDCVKTNLSNVLNRLQEELNTGGEE